MVASAVHIVSAPVIISSDIISSLTSSSVNTQITLFLGLIFSSVGGLVVAAILKRLDNVVKVINSELCMQGEKRRFTEQLFNYLGGGGFCS